jgi:hypothetical protein
VVPSVLRCIPCVLSVCAWALQGIEAVLSRNLWTKCGSCPASRTSNKGNDWHVRRFVGHEQRSETEVSAFSVLHIHSPLIQWCHSTRSHVSQQGDGFRKFVKGICQPIHIQIREHGQHNQTAAAEIGLNPWGAVLRCRSGEELRFPQRRQSEFLHGSRSLISKIQRSSNGREAISW